MLFFHSIAINILGYIPVDKITAPFYFSNIFINLPSNYFFLKADLMGVTNTEVECSIAMNNHLFNPLSHCS